MGWGRGSSQAPILGEGFPVGVHVVLDWGVCCKNHSGYKNTERYFSSGDNLEEIGFGHRQTSEEDSGSGQSTIIDTRHPFFATQPNLANPLNDFNDCVRAGVHPQRGGQTRSSLAARDKTDQSQRLVQAERSACVRRGEGRNAFAENPLRAFHVMAIKMPRMDFHPDGDSKP
jgi:hypothetical protein